MMSDIDELLAELTQPRQDPTPPKGPSVRAAETTGARRRPSIWWFAAGLALLTILLGGLAALAAGGDESTISGSGDRRPTPTGASAATTTGPTASVAALAGPATKAVGSSPVDTTAAPSDTGDAPADPPADKNPQGAVRYVTISGLGQVTLRGEVPTRAAGDALVANLVTATGGPVLDELTVTPTAPADTAVAVYLPDRLLFDFNSIEIGPADLRQLDLTARLLAAFPDLTVRVVARTDATGSDDLNLRVADLRATAVCNYLLSIGASPTQIVLDPVGEADEPHDEQDDDDATTDRHVELVIEGTLRG